MTKIDKDEFQKRLDRMTELFSEMVEHADTQSRYRCPYRDRHDHCTAKIRCRNQDPTAAADGAILCRHDGQFDYRSAWESRPDNYPRAKAKIATIKRAAAASRAGRRKK